MKQHEHSSTFSTKIIKLQQNFQQICLSSGHPLNYCELVLQALNNRHYQNKQEEYKFKMYSFADQINRIKKGSSFCHQIDNILNEREQIVRQLRSQLINSRISKQLNLSTACQKLQSIRMYNLKILEKVIRLRNQFKVTQSAYFNQITQRISEDTDFLKLSPLRNHIPFSSNRDPLFIVPLDKFCNEEPNESMQRRPIIDLFNVDAEYQKRLLKADSFLRKLQAKLYIPFEDDAQNDISLIDQQRSYTVKKQDVEGKSKNIDEIPQSTLQKFILPSVNVQKRIPNDKTRNHVSHIIKDIITDYEQRDRMRTQQPYFTKSPKNKKKALYRSDQKSKKRHLQRSIFADSRNQQIRYRFDKVQSFFNKQKSQRKKIAINQKLPQLTKSIDRNSNIQYNTYQDEYQDIVENKAHTVDIIDPQARKIRRNTGKIIKNYTAKTQPTQYQQFDRLANRIPSPYKLIDYYEQQQHLSASRQRQMPKKIYFNSYQTDHVQVSSRSIDQKQYVSTSNKNLGLKIDPNPLKNSSTYIQGDKKVQRIINLQRGQGNKQQDANRMRLYNISKQYNYDQHNTKNAHLDTNLQRDFKSVPVPNHQIINQFDLNNTPTSPKNKKFQIQRTQTMNHVLQITVSPKPVIHKDFRQDSNQNIKQLNKIQKLTPFQSDNSRNLTSSQGSVIASPKFMSNTQYQHSLTSNIDPTVTFNNSNNKNLHLNTEFQSQNQKSAPNQAQNRPDAQFSDRQSEPQINVNPVKQTRQNIQIYQFNTANTGSRINPKHNQLNHKNQNVEPINKNISNSNSNSKETQPVSLPPSNNTQINKNIQFVSPPKKNTQPIDANNTQPISTLPSSNIQQISPAPSNNITNNKTIDKKVTQSQNIKSKNQPNNQSQNKTVANINTNLTVQNKPVTNNANTQLLQTQKQTQNKPSQSNTAIVAPESKNTNLIQSPNLSQPKQINKSVISVQNPISQTTNNKIPVNTGPVQQFPITKQQKATLQKCIFQSKSITQQDLLKQIKTLSPAKYEALQTYLTASFFTNRQINLTNCLFNNQIVCFCISFPQITLNRRLLYLLHIEISQQKMIGMQAQFISTFIKYIFTNDPCQKIIYPNHTDLMTENHKNLCQSLKNYAGQVKNPVKMPYLNENALSFQRKGVVCKQVQTYTSIINTFALFVCATTNKMQFQPTKTKNFKIQAAFLKKMQIKLTSRQAQHFKDQKQLTDYLEQQGLPIFKKIQLHTNMMYTSFILEDCLLRNRFLVHGNQFFFTIQPPYTYLFQNQTTYFMLIVTSDSKKFYVFGDKLYEQAQDIDMLKQFNQKVNDKPLQAVFNAEEGKGKVISCPQFKKQLQVQVSHDLYTNFTVQLNWKEYMRGVRYLKQDKVYLQLIVPFFCGMVEIDQKNNMQLMYSCYITEDQVPK